MGISRRRFSDRACNRSCNLRRRLLLDGLEDVAADMTADQARALLRKIRRALPSNPGYVEPLSDLEIEGWVELFEAMGLVSGSA